MAEQVTFQITGCRGQSLMARTDVGSLAGDMQRPGCTVSRHIFGVTESRQNENQFGTQANTAQLHHPWTLRPWVKGHGSSGGLFTEPLADHLMIVPQPGDPRLHAHGASLTRI